MSAQVRLRRAWHWLWCRTCDNSARPVVICLDWSSILMDSAIERREEGP